MEAAGSFVCVLLINSKGPDDVFKEMPKYLGHGVVFRDEQSHEREKWKE